MKEYLFMVVSMIFIQNDLFCMGVATNVILPSGINVLATSKDGRYIVAGYADGKVYIVGLESPDDDNIKKFQNNNSPVTAITCGSNYIVIGCKSGDIYVLNYNLRLLSSFHAHTDEISILATDESWVAAVSKNGLLKVFDLDRPNLEYMPYCLCTVQSEKKINALALNRHRGLLAFSQTCFLVVWDVVHDTSVSHLCASSGDITACALYDTTLWISARDGDLHAWDIISGKHVKAIKAGKVLLSLCMNMDNNLLIGLGREKVAYAFNCASGTCVEKVRPIYPYVNNCIISGETVLFSQKDGDIEIQPIGLSFLFKNDLDSPISCFTFVDEDQRVYKIEKCCKAHDCVRIVADFLLNRLSKYQIRLQVSKTSALIIPLLKLLAVREMCLAQYIENAKILLWLGKKFPNNRELKWTCHVPSVLEKVPVPAVPEEVPVPAIPTEKKWVTVYAMEALINLSLIDYREPPHSVPAEQRKDLKYIWDLNEIGHNGPFTLSALTDKGELKWRIPYVPGGSEIFIKLPRHDLSLWQEFTSQELTICVEK